MKFKFGQSVTVNDSFFEGIVGKIKDRNNSNIAGMQYYTVQFKLNGVSKEEDFHEKDIDGDICLI